MGRIIVTGGRGLVGSALGQLLESKGHEVWTVTRSPKKPHDIRWDVNAGELDAQPFEGADAVVHLAGENVGQRWTEERKRRILESRTKGTGLLASTLAGLSKPPPVLLCASAVGYYGDPGEETVDASSPKGEGFLSDVCEAWEKAADPAREAGLRVAHARIGIVMSAKDGALKKMLTPFRMGLGGRIGDGKQFMSWVHEEDVARAFAFALEHPIEGPFNLTAPTPVTNAAFTDALGNALRRPTAIPLPRFAAKLGLGSEMAQEMLLSGQRAIPRVLQEAGFQFKHTEIEAALKDLLG